MPGQTKIGQFGLIFQSEENVARLDIVVNDSAMMGGTHPLGNFANLIGNGAIIPLGAVRQPVGQTSARANRGRTNAAVRAAGGGLRALDRGLPARKTAQAVSLDAPDPHAFVSKSTRNT